MMPDLEALPRHMDEKAEERDRVNKQKSASGDAYRNCARMVREAAEKNVEKGAGE